MKIMKVSARQMNQFISHLSMSSVIKPLYIHLDFITLNEHHG